MEKSDLEDAQLLAFPTEAAAPSEINGRCKPLGYPATNCRDGDKSLGNPILANTISELTGAVVCPTHSLIAGRKPGGTGSEDEFSATGVR